MLVGVGVTVLMTLVEVVGSGVGVDVFVGSELVECSDVGELELDCLLGWMFLLALVSEQLLVQVLGMELVSCAGVGVAVGAGVVVGPLYALMKACPIAFGE